MFEVLVGCYSRWGFCVFETRIRVCVRILGESGETAGGKDLGHGVCVLPLFLSDSSVSF